MGFEQNKIWEQYRDQFPVTKNLIYLNHAAVAPLCKSAADAIRWLANDCEKYGSLHYDVWMKSYDSLRQVTAQLINAQSSEIAIVKNTSEGIATIANGLDWKSGDRIVVFEEEFPSNQYPWQRLQSKGVTLEWLRADGPMDKLEQAAKGARMVAISFVQFLTGFRADLETIGKICQQNGCFFFVDAIQGMGYYPLDVQKCNIHALAADGHKWMLGSEGCGVLYVRADVQDQIEPFEFGWTNVQNYADYGQRTLTLRSDAGRYEPGTLNTVGVYGLEASIKFLLSVGIEPICEAVLARTKEIHDGVLEKGYEVLGERNPSNDSGIVCFRKPGLDFRMIHKQLKDNGILTAPRAGWVRASPHFYISPEDVQRFLSVLP